MTKEFNLIKRNKDMFDQAREDKSNKQTIINAIEQAIKIHNKEFIKRLKEDLSYVENKERENLHVRAFCKAFKQNIDKRSGEELSNHIQQTKSHISTESESYFVQKKENKTAGTCKCGCKEEDHELYEFMDGIKERIFCNNCGEISCKKYEVQDG